MLGPAGSRSSRETRGIEHDGFCCRRKSQILTSTWPRNIDPTGPLSSIQVVQRPAVEGSLKQQVAVPTRTCFVPQITI